MAVNMLQSKMPAMCWSFRCQAVAVLAMVGHTYVTDTVCFAGPMQANQCHDSIAMIRHHVDVSVKHHRIWTLVPTSVFVVHALSLLHATYAVSVHVIICIIVNDFNASKVDPALVCVYVYMYKYLHTCT